MEYKGRFYFEWPDRYSIVYAVDPEAIGCPCAVDLPDTGVVVQLVEKEGYVEVTEVRKDSQDGRKRFLAKPILNSKGEANPTFAGSWDPLIPLIDATAMVNGLFSVNLPPEEYQRLVANGEAEFEVLKKMVSPRAASLMQLVDWDGNQFRVDLYRVCVHSACH